MLTLPIKKKWFKMIKSGEKKEEYRELSQFYDTRLQRFVGKIIPVRLSNGYASDSPKMDINVLVTVGIGISEWGAISNKKYYVLKIVDDNI